VKAIVNVKGLNMRQVLLIPDSEVGGFTVEVPSLPGCISEGDTREEALANIKEAIEAYIESMIKHGEEIPDDVGTLELSVV
jgi:antitoxin HicB